MFGKSLDMVEVSLARRSAMFGKSLDMVECRWLVVLPSPRSEVVAGQELDVDGSAAVCRLGLFGLYLLLYGFWNAWWKWLLMRTKGICFRRGVEFSGMLGGSGRTSI
ncbi:uncharacterized protein LOC143916805 [Arctopsyche grandis]|uniref:uncharacterized protein LOC143916805 n=1 Tax=Arctopsyche grandis TaxID=121162 RepID=UPI00406D687D